MGRRTTALLTGLAAVTAVCSSCSSSPTQTAGGDGDGGAPSSTVVVDGSTATTVRHLRDDPACQTLVRYRLAELAMSDGSPERRAEARVAATAAGRDLRTLLPQFSAEVDQLLSTLQKVDTGSVTDADRTADRRAMDAIGSWYGETCFDTSGGPP